MRINIYRFRGHSRTRAVIFVSSFFGVACPHAVQAQDYVAPVEESSGAELVLDDGSSIAVSTAIPNSITALTSRNPGSRVLAEGLSINTVNAIGVSGVNGGRIDLANGGEINVAGAFSTAVAAEDAEVNISGSSAANQFRINASDTSVGVMIGGNGHVTLDHVSVSVSDDGVYGVLALGVFDKAYFTASNSVFSMDSRDSTALRADYNAVMNVSDSQIITSESVGVGIYALHGAEVNLTGNSSINTAGPSGVGVFVSAQGADPTVVNLIAGAGNQIQINTAGFIGFGVYAQGANSFANLDGVSINTTGPNAAAVRADNGATVTLNQGRVITSGMHSYGLNANDIGTHIDARDMSISTSADGTSGLLLQNGGRVSLTGSVIEAGGVGATGAYLNGGGEVLDLHGSQLSSAQSYGIYSLDGSAEINLMASTVTGATGAIYADASAGVGNVMLLSASQNSRVDGDIFAAREFSGSFNGSALNGHIVALSPSTLTDNIALNFTDGSIMTGSASGVSHAGFIDSTWVMTDSSTLTGLSSSAGGLSLSNGQVIFAAQGANYKTLTASALDGNGAFELNTSLNQGSSSTQSDLIHVIGSASGNYQLGINNTDGSGARTQGDGIRVVQLDDASNSASFELRRPVVAGAYEYFLYEGGEADADDWYLRSVLVPNSSGGEPAYNPSVVGYSAGSYVNRMYGFDTIGTLHQRMGGQAISRESGASQGSWARIGGGKRKLQSGRFNYDVDTWFAQFGNDLYQADNADGSRTQAGVMATIGQTNMGAADLLRKQRAGLSARAGSLSSKSYGAGAYFTHHLKDESYLDVVGQFTHHSNDYSSVYGANASQNANGLTVSVEAGKPFKFDSGWYVEPQAQLMLQYLRSSGFEEGAASVKGASDKSGLVRLGARIGHDALFTSGARPYITANVLNSIGSDPQVDVSGVSMRNDYSQQWAELGVGVAGDVTEGISVYADLRYQHAFDGDMHGVGGNLGVRVSW